MDGSHFRMDVIYATEKSSPLPCPSCGRWTSIIWLLSAWTALIGTTSLRCWSRWKRPICRMFQSSSTPTAAKTTLSRGTSVDVLSVQFDWVTCCFVLQDDCCHISNEEDSGSTGVRVVGHPRQHLRHGRMLRLPPGRYRTPSPGAASPLSMKTTRHNRMCFYSSL